MLRGIAFSSVVLVIMALSTVFVGCDSKENTDSFDRGPMLRQYADNLIIPAYNDAVSKVNTLETAVTAFTSNPSSATLTILQNAWVNAYLSWQYASPYNFGPAAASGTIKPLIEEVATFPVSTEKIENAVSTGTYNLNDFNRDARGYLAVEYLIFNLEDDNAAIISSFSSATRKEYLTALVADIKTRLTAVANAWNGTYKNTFVSLDGIDAGSGTSMLYNEFVKSYEAIKNYKVALPLGLRAGQVATEPTRVEAYYSGTSIQMIKAHYSAIENIWYGRAKNGNDGIGFHEYLKEVQGGPALIQSTESQMAVIRAALEPLSDTPRYSVQIDSDPEPLIDLHTALQQHIRYFKNDMSSLLGIYITYDSGDGD
jgi:uncharacterized protein